MNNSASSQNRSRTSRTKRHDKLPKIKAGSRQAKQVLNANASAIGTMLEVLSKKLDALERDIRSDEEGKKEYEDQILRLNIRKDDLCKRLKRNKEWAAKFDKDIGPFEEMYDKMTAGMENLYENAKTQHAKGVRVLKSEFNYHPMFKKPGSTFSAVPFRPK